MFLFLKTLKIILVLFLLDLLFVFFFLSFLGKEKKNCGFKIRANTYTYFTFV